MTARIPTVNLQKPVLPTLWLDTSIIIKVAKIRRGERLQEIEVERCNRLQKLVVELVRAGRLLCPESEQEEEYVAQRLDDDVHSTFHSLSFGISLEPRQGIMDEHIFIGMEAYAIGSTVIDVPSSSFFHRDPYRQLDEVRKRRIFATVGPIRIPEWLKRRIDTKLAVHRTSEQIRQQFVASGRTYEEQLEEEKKGEIKSILIAVKRFQENLLAGKFDPWDYMGAMGGLQYMDYWTRLGAQPCGWEGLWNFFCSPYFNELPLPYIACRLGAELLTGNEPIATGDSKDIDLLSVALPVAHYVLTDRRMEQRIKKLGLDEMFHAEVFSMSTVDGLFGRLERLRQTDD
jgi:hypothetical protein